MPVTRTLAVLAFASLVVGCVTRPERDAADEPVLALTHVTVVDVEAATLLADMTVIVARDRIAAMGPAASIPLPQTADVVDATGQFLIPGLWDMHVHLAEDPALPWPREVYAPLLVANGVTGVRDMRSDPDEVLASRRDIDQGMLQAPTIVTAGLMLDGPKPLWPSSTAINSPADGREAVVLLKDRGVDFIKVQSLVPEQAFSAIVDEAQKHRLPVVGHVPFALQAIDAIDAGLQSAEHIDEFLLGLSTKERELKARMLAMTANGEFSNQTFLRIQHDAVSTYDDRKARALWQRMIQRRAGFCPTLRLARIWTSPGETSLWADPQLKYVPAKWKDKYWKALAAMSKGLTDKERRDASILVQKHRDIVAAMNRTGVAILAGTDMGVPGFALHDELGELVNAGLTPAAALQTATINAARQLNREEWDGTVEPGKRANLVLLNANPLVSVANLQRIEAVVLRGQLLDRPSLDRMVAAVEKFAARP